MLNPDQKLAALRQAEARVSYLPSHSGDGYGYGGGAILTIGDVGLPIGEGFVAGRLAEEMAARWNAARQALAQVEESAK
jgi:hypothetical protein